MAISFTRAMKRFEAAVRDHELIGAAHPADRDHIQSTYHQAKKDLREAFDKKKVSKNPYDKP
jgi:hypothetical protein